MNKVAEFKKELKVLLNKYNVAIDFAVGEGSDLHGIHNEKMEVYFFDTKTTVFLCHGMGITEMDL